MKTMTAKDVADARYNHVGTMMHRYMDVLLTVSNMHFTNDGEAVDIAEMMDEYCFTPCDVYTLSTLEVGEFSTIFYTQRDYVKLRRIS